MLPDLLSVASSGTGIFAAGRPGFSLRAADARVTVRSLSGLFIEPWPEIDARTKARVLAPDLRRSGKQVEGREGAIPFFDRADYTFGLVGDDGPVKAGLLHRGYLRVLGEAAEETGSQRLRQALEALSDARAVSLAVAEAKSRFDLGQRSVVAVYDDEGPLFDDTDFTTFWQDRVSLEIVDAKAPRQQCSICGTADQPVVSKFPSEVVLTGQKCQITSFNAASFQSYGKEQTRQASICVRCASALPAAMQAMLQPSSGHSRVVYRHTPKSGTSDPMKSLTAIFWVEPPPASALDGLDWEATFADFDMEGTLSASIGLVETQDLQEGERTAAPHPDQILSLLRGIAVGADPRRAKAIDAAAFHVVLLAPNTGRLIVRDHLRRNITPMLESAGRFLRAARGFRFDEKERVLIRKPLGVASLGRLLHQRGSEPPTLVRSLLRSAMTEETTPVALRQIAVSRLVGMLVKGQRDDAVHDAAIAALLLHLSYTNPRYRTMAESNEITEDQVEHMTSAAFHSGRLLAVMDAIQRTTDPKIPKTSAEKIVATAAAFPARAMVPLQKRTIAVYVPKVADKYPGLARLYGAALDATVRRAVECGGGIPDHLDASQQSEFLAGFSLQRELMRREQEVRRLRRENPTNDAK